MTSQLSTCDRCDSKIVTEPHRSYPETLTLTRETDDGLYATRDAELCSICWDDLWDWVFGEDPPDRSHLSDPKPLDRMASSVEGHIEALEEILDSLNAEMEAPPP